MTLDEFKARLAGAVERGKGHTADPEFQREVAAIEQRIAALRRREREIAEARREPVKHWAEGAEK